MTSESLSWAPSRAVFFKRVLMTALLTFVGLSVVGAAVGLYSGLSFGWAFFVAFMLTLGFAAEDLLRWRGARNNLWELNAGQLIYDGPEGRSHVPVSQIVDVKTQFGTRVILKLSSGQRIAMRHLPDAAKTAEQIRQACGPKAA